MRVNLPAVLGGLPEAARRISLPRLPLGVGPEAARRISLPPLPLGRVPAADPSRPPLPGLDTRAELIPAPQPTTSPDRPAGDRHVVVVGGGIAGVSAATSLAERGVRVTLLEACDSLGGRVRSWPVAVPGDDLGRATMSRGFHAFFRQYYNLRALLRRVDPALRGLAPVEDYPLVHADGSRDSFTDVPRRPPFNILGFVAKSPSFGAVDLLRVDVERALALLDVDFPRTFGDYDGVSAADVLDGLRFPRGMRDLALEVFARSFFADPREFSGGELVGMFHTYFLGSAEGLLFDVATDDFDTTWWAPLGRHLAGLGVETRCGAQVERLEERDGGLRVMLAGGSTGAGGDAPRQAEERDQVVDADAVVLATDRRALQALVAGAEWLGDDAWREAVARQRMAPRFVVQRLWFDRPMRAEAPLFLGTAQYGFLDNVSGVHLFEPGAHEWAARTGGSVVELHAYAVPDDVEDAAVLADLRAQLARLHPELDGAAVVHEEVLIERDCPLVGTDPWADRPGVATPDARVVLAGDGVRCELPVALMERAATTGVQAANRLLNGWGLPGHDLWSVPTTTRFGPGVGAARAAIRALRRLPGAQAVEEGLARLAEGPLRADSSGATTPAATDPLAELTADRSGR